MSPRNIFALLLSFFLTFGLVAKESKLSSLKTFNRAVLLVKEQYVDASRISPNEMLMAVLDSLEKNVAEILVKPLPDNKIIVQVGKHQKVFNIGKLTALWSLSFKLRDILQYIEANVTEKIDSTKLEYIAVNGMLSKLDPHSNFLEPKFSKEMRLSTQGQFGGLGIQISIKDGFLTVISPLDGTPASMVGLKALDRIMKIGDESTINMPLDQAVEKLRGVPNTKVALAVQRGEEPKLRNFVVTRAIIKIESVVSRMLKNGVGYVKVTAFQGNSTTDVSKALSTLKEKNKGDLTGLILDFRNNPGGLLDQSVGIADLFLDGGVVVVTKAGASGKRQEERAKVGSDKSKLPIIVLVNNGSASASEIVAGAIKNRERGIVVGQKTFGKGSVQILYDFPDKSSLKLTVAEYLTPGDESIQSVGIVPDIELRPIVLDGVDRVDIFENDRMREEDLSRHLDSKKIKKHQPSGKFAYLFQVPEEKENAPINKFESDYEIQFAEDLLSMPGSKTRPALLKKARKLIEKRQKGETKKLAKELKKLGVDWSLKENSTTPSKLKFKLIGKPKVKVGEKLRVEIEAQNIGKTPAQRLYGMSNSATRLFKDWEFLYGRLAPGEKKRWHVEFEMPKGVESRSDLMKVNFFDASGKSVGVVDVPVEINGLESPKLEFAYEVKNADSTLRGAKIVSGKDATLQLTIQNSGKEAVDKPTALLKNETGSRVFIKKGRHTFKTLKPGEKATADLSFQIVEDGEPVKLQLQLFDATTGKFWLEDVEIPVGQSFPSISRRPPSVKFMSIPKSQRVNSDQFDLVASISDKDPLLDAYLFVNEQKVLYKDLKGEKNTSIKQKIDLKPGINIVSLVARKNKTYAERETLILFSEVGDPLSKRTQ